METAPRPVRLRPVPAVVADDGRHEPRQREAGRDLERQAAGVAPVHVEDRAAGADPELVVYFHRDDLAPRLERPLAETLSPKTPLQNTITPAETKTIDRLTEPHIFRFQLQQAPQGDAILVLQAPPA